jgi:cellulose synthase operon protein YhjQ
MAGETIVVASPKGGVGRTTLVAQLAAGLTSLGRRCLAIDLDPQNALGMYLGATPASWLGAAGTLAQTAGARAALGVTQLELTASGLADSLRARRAQVAHLPFGAPDAAQRRRAERELLAGGHKLRERLASLSPPRCELRIVDTPAGRNAWSEAALELADLVLVPVLADPACFAELPAFEAYLRSQGLAAYPSRVVYVVNQFVPGRQLACDIVDSMARCLGDRLCPAPLHDDESLRQQLALGSPLVLEEGSQIAADLAALTTFLLERVASMQGASKAHAS